MPKLYIIAGPNGAGKTTLATTLLPEFLECNEFVNADSIAAGLSPFNAKSVAMEAGRLMLERIHNLIEAQTSFAFETTLASRSFVKLVHYAKQEGYDVHLFFIGLETISKAKERVASRVQKGGHAIPEETIARRYQRGLDNFNNLYRPLVTSWHVYDNSNTPLLLATGAAEAEIVKDKSKWTQFLNQSKN